MKNVSIVVRSVNEKIHETLIGLQSTNKFAVNAFTSMMFACINSCNIDRGKTLQQWCDGASVMGGKCNGIQKKRSQRYNKN